MTTFPGGHTRYSTSASTINREVAQKQQQVADLGSTSKDSKKQSETKRPPSWSTDTIVIHDQLFTVIFPEKE